MSIHILNVLGTVFLQPLIQCGGASLYEHRHAVLPNRSSAEHTGKIGTRLSRQRQRLRKGLVGNAF